MTAEQLLELLQQPEGPNLEFKRNVPRDLERLAATLSAFANSDGGTVVIGYDERQREPVGLAHAERDRDRLLRAIEMIRPRPDVDVDIVQLGGRNLVVVEVARGQDFPYAAAGRVVRRQDASVVPIDADAILQRVTRPGEAVQLDEARLANAIEAQAAKIDELARQSGWRAQLPLQLAFLVAGTIIGYLLAGWNPLGF